MVEGRQKAADEKFCADCGAAIKVRAELCPHCGVRQGAAQQKTRVTAAVLALLLGGLGAHKFYLGKPGWGAVYLLFCWTLIPALVALIEGVGYLLSNDADFQVRHVA